MHSGRWWSIDLQRVAMETARFRSAAGWGVLALSFTCMAMNGCTSVPELPPRVEAPATRWQTIDEVLARVPAKANSSWPDGEISLTGKTVGLLEFRGAAEGSARAEQNTGRLLLDIAKNHHLQVVDRSLIEKVKMEKDIQTEGKTNTALAEEVARAGKILSAHYLLLGSVTQYQEQSQNVSLQKIFKPGELERYAADYAAFTKAADACEANLKAKIAKIQYIPYAQNNVVELNQRLMELQTRRMETKSPDWWEQDVTERQRVEFASVASVGLAAKLVDVDTSRIVWFFDAEFRDQSLQHTMGRAVDGLLAAMLANTAPTVPTKAVAAAESKTSAAP
jgi:hypothetical protein